MGYTKRKAVGELDTTTLLLVLGGAGVLFYLATRASTPPVTIIRQPTPVNSSGALTAAEIAAGAGLADTLINDLTGNG